MRSSVGARRSRSVSLAALTACLAACTGRGGGGGSGGPPPSTINPNVGLEALARFDRVAELPGNVRHSHFGGFDLTGGNDDGFSGYDPVTGNRAFLYIDGPELVIFDVEGAGVVNRMNFAFLGGASTPAAWYTPGADDFELRFYFDGETSPRIDLSMADLTSGNTPGFPAPLVGGEFVSPGGPFGYLPLPFEQGLRIAATGLPHFFNLDAHLFPTSLGVKTYEPTDDPSAAVAVLGLVGSDPKPGSENDLSIAWTTSVPPQASAALASILQEGTITAIALRPLNGWNAVTLRQVRLRIAYDGEAVWRVDAPLGLLFGTGFSAVPVGGLGFGRKADGTGYLYFPMPFHVSAQVVLANETGGAIPFAHEVRWRPGPYGAPFGYFGATHAVVPSPVNGEDVPLLDRVGHGKLVGVVADIETGAPPFGRAVLEGDERIFVDDVRTPAVHGTATETFFNWGWYEGPLDAPFSLPMHGYPHHAVIGAVDETSCYRLMYADAVPFHRRIFVGLQHGGINTSPASYDAVVFTYSVDEPALVETDEFDPGSAPSEAAHQYSLVPPAALLEVVSTFEGRERVFVADDGYPVGVSSAFRASVLPENAGVRLVRLSDQSLGRQRARVLVDGTEAGYWYEARTNPFSRWMEDVFEIPAALTAGKTSITIALQPTAGGTSWNEFRYRVYCHHVP